MGAQRGQQLGSSMGTALPSHPWASPCRFRVGLILPKGPFPTAPGAEFSLSGYSRGGCSVGRGPTGFTKGCWWAPALLALRVSVGSPGWASVPLLRSLLEEGMVLVGHPCNPTSTDGGFPVPRWWSVALCRQPHRAFSTRWSCVMPSTATPDLWESGGPSCPGGLRVLGATPSPPWSPVPPLVAPCWFVAHLTAPLVEQAAGPELSHRGPQVPHQVTPVVVTSACPLPQPAGRILHGCREGMGGVQRHPVKLQPLLQGGLWAEPAGLVRTQPASQRCHPKINPGTWTRSSPG